MRYRFLIGLLFAACSAIAQQTSDSTDSLQVILIAENPPEFPGGRTALFRFIGSKLRYPSDARQMGIEGKVYVSFIVERDGSVKRESIKVEHSVYRSLDAEAIRVVKLMPKWIPATHMGQTVRVRTGFPLIFSLH